MGQRRIEREWKPPRECRHIWIYPERGDLTTQPKQGLIVAWRRYRYQWSALTISLDETVAEGRLVQEWLPVERLRPVRSDPNKILRNWRFTELMRPHAD